MLGARHEDQSAVELKEELCPELRVEWVALCGS